MDVPLLIAYPDHKGNINVLRKFLNPESDAQFQLIAGWLTWAIQPDGPFPILLLQGEQGSAKSTTARLLKSVIDPSAVPLRTLPRMADFAKWVTAAEHSLPWENGTFINEYEKNCNSLVDIAIDTDPVATPVFELVKKLKPKAHRDVVPFSLTYLCFFNFRNHWLQFFLSL